MEAVRVQSQNPLDLKDEDLKPLVADLQTHISEYDFQLVEGRTMPPGARGVTWWEVVHVYLPELADDVRAVLVAMLLERAYAWAKARFRRRTESGRDKRPKCIVIHRSDGAEETTMVLRSSRHKPVTQEEAVRPEEPKKRKRKKAPGKTSAKRKRTSKSGNTRRKR